MRKLLIHHSNTAEIWRVLAERAWRPYHYATQFLNLWKYMLCTIAPFWSLQFPGKKKTQKTKKSSKSFSAYFGWKNVCARLNRCNWRTKWVLNFSCNRLSVIFKVINKVKCSIFAWRRKCILEAFSY